MVLVLRLVAGAFALLFLFMGVGFLLDPAGSAVGMGITPEGMHGLNTLRSDVAGVAGLMVSKIPTFSAKRVKIPRSYVGLALLGVAALIAFLVSTPWVTLGVLGLGYLISIPISVMVYRRLKERAAAHGEAPNGSSDQV